MASINMRLRQVSKDYYSESHTEQWVILTDSGEGKYSIEASEKNKAQKKIILSHFHIATYKIRTLGTHNILRNLNKK